MTKEELHTEFSNFNIKKKVFKIIKKKICKGQHG